MLFETTPANDGAIYPDLRIELDTRLKLADNIKRAIEQCDRKGWCKSSLVDLNWAIKAYYLVFLEEIR